MLYKARGKHWRRDPDPAFCSVLSLNIPQSTLFYCSAAFVSGINAPYPYCPFLPVDKSELILKAC